jgi:hypothetical protein
LAEGIDLNGNGPDIESLDFPVDPTTLPTTSELPLGDLLLEIKSVTVTKTKENTTGELNYKGELKVGGKKTVAVQFGLVEPSEFAGLPYTHRFYIGSDADPEAIKPGTWQRNAVLLMAMFKAAQVGGKTFKEYSAAANGQRVGATVKVEKSKDPKYPDKHIVRAFWQPGTKQISLVNVNADMDAVFTPAAPAPSFANND